jgi:hypothetical protein
MNHIVVWPCCVRSTADGPCLYLLLAPRAAVHVRAAGRGLDRRLAPRLLGARAARAAA